jgi:hypothetical protein
MPAFGQKRTFNYPKRIRFASSSCYLSRSIQKRILDVASFIIASLHFNLNTSISQTGRLLAA